MKVHLEPNLDYQLQDIEAVCDPFRGQEICQTVWQRRFQWYSKTEYYV